MLLILEGGPANGRQASQPIYVDDRIPVYFYTVNGGSIRHYCALYDVYGQYMMTTETEDGRPGEIFLAGYSVED